jgi:hypothetical protein
MSKVRLNGSRGRLKISSPGRQILKLDILIPRKLISNDKEKKKKKKL